MNVTLKIFVDLLQDASLVCLGVWDGPDRWFSCMADKVPADLLDRVVESFDLGTEGLVVYLEGEG